MRQTRQSVDIEQTGSQCIRFKKKLQSLWKGRTARAEASCWVLVVEGYRRTDLPLLPTCFVHFFMVNIWETLPRFATAALTKSRQRDKD